MAENYTEPLNKSDILPFLKELADLAEKKLAIYGHDLEVYDTPLYVAGLMPQQEVCELPDKSLPPNQIIIDTSPDETYVHYALSTLSGQLTRPGLEARIVSTRNVRLVKVVGKAWQIIDRTQGGVLVTTKEEPKLELDEPSTRESEVISPRQLTELQGIVLRGLTYYGKGLELGRPDLHRIN